MFRCTDTVFDPKKLIWAILIAAFIILLMYIFLSGYRDEITFTASALGAAGAIASAIYIGAGLKQSANAERFRLTFSYLERWNSPSFFERKKDWRNLMRQIRDDTRTDRVQAVRQAIGGEYDKEAVLIEMLNFFEEIAIVVDQKVADESVLKDAFKTVIERTCSLLEEWIEERRREMGSRSLRAISNLYREWQA